MRALSDPPDGDTLRAVLAHPRGDYSGNLCWTRELTPTARRALSSGLSTLRTRGYWASAFPEGDGVAFNKPGAEPYDPREALADLASCLPFLAIEPVGDDESLTQALARLAKGQTLRCTCLIPVEGLRLDEPIAAGSILFHPRVDGERVRLRQHPWADLCDEPGADVDPAWSPGKLATGTTELLGYVLIERSVEVPLDLLYGAADSVGGSERLLRYLLDAGDQALDPIRFALCHYRRLEYLPNKPGWIGDNASVYVRPQAPFPPERLVTGKPYVLRVSNNWLGLEMDPGVVDATTARLAAVVDDPRCGELDLAIESALRALNKAFYLVDLEASFLHLVYATDAICDPGRLTGDRHRVWVAAFASAGDPRRFERLLPAFDVHYGIRNDIVHAGETIASLGLRGEEECQFMLEVLGSCITALLNQAAASRHAVTKVVFDLLATPHYEAAIAKMGSTQFKLPVAQDKGFAKHAQS